MLALSTFLRQADFAIQAEFRDLFGFGKTDHQIVALGLRVRITSNSIAVAVSCSAGGFASLGDRSGNRTDVAAKLLREALRLEEAEAATGDDQAELAAACDEEGGRCAVSSRGTASSRTIAQASLQSDRLALVKLAPISRSTRGKSFPPMCIYSSRVIGLHRQRSLHREAEFLRHREGYPGQRDLRTQPAASGPSYHSQ